VKLQQGFKHKFEDGDEITFKEVKGMNLISDPTKSINETIHKVKVINTESFSIEDTTLYSVYESSGLVKQLKSIKEMKFMPLSKVDLNDPPFDQNLLIHDFEKIDHIKWAHFLFEYLSRKEKCFL
jgi:hypothetical protein